MAHKEDILEELIVDGRVRTTAVRPYSDATVLTVNFYTLATILKAALRYVYSDHEPLSLRHKYDGTSKTITAAINSDVDHMVDFALWIALQLLQQEDQLLLVVCLISLLLLLQQPQPKIVDAGSSVEETNPSLLVSLQANLLITR